jgi:hypothetical protein
MHSPYRELGIEILRTAVRLAAYRSDGISDDEARRRALWAVILTLLNVVPRTQGQGSLIVAHITQFTPKHKWTTARSLYNTLLVHLSSIAQQQDKDVQLFTIVPPNEPHSLLFRAVDVLNDMLDAPFERVVPVIPLVLSVFTLDIYRVIYLIRLRQTGSRLRCGIEVWPLTDQNISATSQALRQAGVNVNAPARGHRSCAALSFQLNWLVFLRELFRRRPYPSQAYLMHEAVELFPYLLQRIVLARESAARSCTACQSTFSDPLFLERAQRLAAMTTRQKFGFVNAAAQYGKWLRTDCVKLARRTFKVSPNLHNEPPRVWIQGATPATESDPLSYCVGDDHGTPLAKFVPALGQIWVLPTCPDSLLTRIQTHEIQHHNDCALQPSQLLHFRHVLLDRPLPEPDRFTDLVEASYVLGLTVDAGFPPQPRYFPPAPLRIRQLARGIARVARHFANSAQPGLETKRSQIEAARAVLFLLHHVIPAKAGVGGAVVREIARLRPSPGWREHSELWAALHMRLLQRLEQPQQSAPFRLALPIDPHRSLGEMLVFLAHCVQPIPERGEAVVKTLPTLISVLSFGSMICIPIVRVKRQGDRYTAEISVLHGDDESEESVQKVVGVQSALLRQWTQKGIDCACTRYLVGLLRATRRHRASSDPARIDRFLTYVLNHLMVESFLRNHSSCRLCQENLRAPTVREAAETIQLNLPHARRWLPHAARAYEAWLSSGCIDLICRNHGLTGRMSVVKKYRFL